MSRDEAAPGIPVDIPEVLKSLLEYSLPRTEQLKEKEKAKLVDDDDEAAGSALQVSASLMPPIWDKTIPYDGESFHLEYMDLDEFLLENGISSQLNLNPAVQNSLLPVDEMEEKEPKGASSCPSSPSVAFKASDNTGSSSPKQDAPSPVNPEGVQVHVNFNPDPSDLVMSSVPGGELFDPRKHKFTDKELKPQPMIKKAKKIYVPDEAKDEKYWSRRKKNNVAAKRSRDARRLKENQITVRAAFLEKENMALRMEVAELRKQVGKCKTILSKYQSKYGLFDPCDSE
uniref:Thyrotroph embryonic factor n=1 Tax=Geotrypetes seraphini TaxID=260995 RepID=A0A6P8P7Q9_GEOSA|nr:thyrotroph embryonic factor [Geotrypetes seraphini]